MTDHVNELAKVPKPSSELLNPREKHDYREFRKKLFYWLLAQGKDPEKFEGYASDTVKIRGYIIDGFYRWLWQREGGYRTQATVEDADNWFRDEVASSTKSNSYKNSCIKALQTLFKYQHHVQDTEFWTPPY
jgi:hypothetical protein